MIINSYNQKKKKNEKPIYFYTIFSLQMSAKSLLYVKFIKEKNKMPRSHNDQSKFRDYAWQEKPPSKHIRSLNFLHE